MARQTIAYRGPAAHVSLLVQMLEEDGQEVIWERPAEARGTSEIAETVVAQLVAVGTWEGAKAVVARFRGRAGGRASVVIAGDGGFEFDSWWPGLTDAQRTEARELDEDAMMPSWLIQSLHRQGVAIIMPNGGEGSISERPEDGGSPLPDQIYGAIYRAA